MIESIALTQADDGSSAASFEDSSWLLEARVVELAETPYERRTPDGESFLLVLSGTHDLYAGGGSWMQRGLRETPYEGRPLGVYLPPSTPYKLENGRGFALTWSVRQPELPEPESPKESLSQKPLLQMSGSGKAFDPATGTWKPKEAFLTSPEAILPRRIAKLEIGDGVIAERILDLDYKSLGLCLDEVVIPDGATIELPEHSGRQQPREVAIYHDAEGELQIGDVTVRGRGAVRCGDSLPALSARGGRAYVNVCYAGPKAG